MSLTIQLMIVGLAVGSLYALLSLGIVVIYRGSGTINFAHGSVAMVGAFLYLDLRKDYGFGFVAAFLVAVGVCALIGLATHLLIMRPLRNASPVTRLIATLGIVLLLEQGATIIFGVQSVTVPSPLPLTRVQIFGTTLTEATIIVFILGIVGAGLLWVVYRWTKFGLLTSAVAENRPVVARLGYSPDVIASVNWMVGCALAGIVGILLAPVTGLQVDQYTTLVIPVLAAAAVGGFVSFPLCTLAALALGVAESEASRLTSLPGIGGTIPLLIIVLALIFRSRSVGHRSLGAVRLPLLGSGRIRWWVVAGWAALVIVLVSQVMTLPWISAVTVTMGFGIVLLSVVIVTGYSGQLSLAQLGIAGIAAWVAGRAFDIWSLPLWSAWALGIVATIPVGLLIGYACAWTRGINLAIATLGLGLALDQVVFQNPSMTGGFAGTTVPTASLFGLDITPTLHPTAYAIVVLVGLVLAGLLTANLRRSRAGRRFVATRANERAAASLGVNVISSKTAAFTWGSIIAGIGGIMIGFSQGSIQFTTFDTVSSLFLLPQAVIGGVGWIAGGVVGGLQQPGGLAAQVLNLLGSNAQQYLGVISGFLLIVTLLQAPDGLAHMNLDAAQKLWRFVRRRFGSTADQGASAGPVVHEADVRTDLGALHARARTAHRSLDGRSNRPAGSGTSAVLSVSDLVMRFGAVTAVDRVSLEIRRGEVLGLIGPNGAGKTTIIDAISGFRSPRSGTVTFGDRDITKMSAVKRARLGITRSFQSLELFDDMTVAENLRVASEDRKAGAFVSGAVWPGKVDLSEEALAAVEEFGLTPYLTVVPTALPYGLRRLLAIARAVATRPSVLLLDEPAAGLDDRESEELGVLVRSLAERWGIAVLLVEHDMTLVMSVCDRIHAIDFGRTIAEGRPADVRANSALVDAYLGREGDTEHDPVGLAPIIEQVVTERLGGSADGR